MFLDELEIGQPIKIVAKTKEESFEFDTKVVETTKKNHSAFVGLVFNANGKVIDFGGKGIVRQVHIFPEGSSPLVFKNVLITIVRKKTEGYVYCIYCPSEAVVLNRRQSYRMYIGKDIEMQCGFNHSTINAILKDVSASGFAISVNQKELDEKNLELRENQVVHFVLSERIEEMYKNYNFQMYGLIVRQEKTENGVVVYGCKLNNKVAGLENYIAIKERLRIKQNSLNKNYNIYSKGEENQ